MVEMSKFAHVFDLGDDLALYHSLRMKPVYLHRKAFEALEDWLADGDHDSADSAPDDIKAEVAELVKCKILTQSDGEDDRVLQFVRSRMPEPATAICYMILSEQCNLACKYCFLGNNDDRKRSEFLLESMTVETADAALDFFVRQMKESDLDVDKSDTSLIFYGGEPLVNYAVLEHVAERVNSMRATERYLEKLEMSMVSNGLLLDEARITRLKELGVGIAISIDGFTEAANSMRVDTAGRPAFPRIREKLDLCKRLGADVSLSVTLSEETIKSTEGVLDLIDEYNIKGLGFNIMMSSDTFVLPESYNEAASRFIIEEFVELRKRGIYEDRVMRKLKSFMNARVYFSDCGATAGGQIVVAPDGRVGVCHGCLFDKRYFVGSVFDDGFVAVKDPTFLEWAGITPLNNPECYSCPALGICGGGCPINAMTLKEGNTIHSIDERFCVHAKRTLEFFIEDLHAIILKNRGTE